MVRREDSSSLSDYSKKCVYRFSSNDVCKWAKDQAGKSISSIFNLKKLSGEGFTVFRCLLASYVWGKNSRTSYLSRFLRARYWWAIVPSLGTFQLSVLEINSLEGTKNIVWEMANIPNNFAQKTNATEQIQWCRFFFFSFTLRLKCVTQFSPEDPFEIELYEKTKNSNLSKMHLAPHSLIEQEPAIYLINVYGPCTQRPPSPYNRNCMHGRFCTELHLCCETTC